MIASASQGITRNQSVSRMRTESVNPPRYPEMIPIADPITIETTVASRPTIREILEPHTTRDSTERPMLSVPNGYSKLGGARIGPSTFVGSRSA